MEELACAPILALALEFSEAHATFRPGLSNGFSLQIEVEPYHPADQMALRVVHIRPSGADAVSPAHVRAGHSIH